MSDHLKRMLAGVVGLIVLLFGGRGLYRHFQGGGPGGHGGPPPTPVVLTELRQEQFFSRVKLTGDARSRARAVIRSQVEGVVARVLVEEGDRVHEGAPVATLEGSDQVLQAAQARARLAEAESRLSELLEGTRPEVVAQRKAELDAAEAREKEAEANLESVKKLAPTLLAQKQADAYSAQARERDAQDNLERTQKLVEQGAVPERQLVSVRAALDAARGERLRADHAFSGQSTENRRDELRAEADLADARSQTAKARAAYNEALEGPRSEVIAAQRNAVEAMRAQLEQAQLSVSRTEITSTVEGTVSQRQISPGDRVSVGDPALTVTSPEVDVFFQVPERLLGEVKPGMTVLLKTPSLGDWEGKGKVEAVVQAAEDRTRGQTIRVSGPSDRLLPGMSIAGELLIPAEGSYLVVERDALVRQPEGWSLFTVDAEQKAHAHQVELVAEAGAQVAIRVEGLKPGQSVVKRGAPGLREGGTVVLPQAEEKS